MPYAHAVIVDPRTDFRYERGKEVPENLPGMDELREFGSVRDEPYEEPEVRDPVVLSAEQVDGLSPQARQELEGLGLTVADRYVTGADHGRNTEAQA